MPKTVALACGVLLLAGSFPAAVPAAPVPPAAQAAAATKAADPWLARTTRLQFQPQPAADDPIRLDLPVKDWMVLPSSGSLVLAMASRKGDAVVLVERSAMRQALEADEITELFAQIEVDGVKERYPKAVDFFSKVLDLGVRRLVAVQYGRPGVLGPERVRQYSIPVGRQLYRVTCISRAALFAAYEPVFSHIAASFTTTE
jgi:hypothetical protein